MSGETDLARLLRSLHVDARPGEYVFACLPPGPAPAWLARAEATVREREGLSCVLPREDADARALAYDFVATWLTITVHSALDAVGLTASVSKALADRGIPCNVIAGFHHDHLLVAADRRADALDALAGLARASTG